MGCISPLPRLPVEDNPPGKRRLTFGQDNENYCTQDAFDRALCIF